MTVQIYLAVGGPLHGNRVTEQYAGPDYHRYNSADKVPTRKCGWCKRGLARNKRKTRNPFVWVHTHDKLGTFACSVQDPDKPRCVLVHSSLWEVPA